MFFEGGNKKRGRGKFSFVFVLSCGCLFPGLTFATTGLVDPGISFVAERNPEALANRRTMADGEIIQPLARVGKNQVFVGGRLENFLNFDPELQPVLGIFPTQQLRASAFIAGKRQITDSIAADLELGGFVTDQEHGFFSTGKTEIDFELLRLRARASTEVYAPRQIAVQTSEPTSNGWRARVVGDLSLMLRGLGPLPDESVLEVDAHIEHDFGEAYRFTDTKQSTFADMNLKFTTPFAGSDDIFSEDPESRLTIEAYVDTLKAIELSGEALLFLKTTERADWFASFEAVLRRNASLVSEQAAQFGLEAFEGDQFVARAGVEGTINLNPKHVLAVDAGLLFERSMGTFDDFFGRLDLSSRDRVGASLGLQHDWHLGKGFKLSNKAKGQVFVGNQWDISYQPEITYDTLDFSISAFGRLEWNKRRGLTQSKTTIAPEGFRPTDLVLGGSLSLYRLDAPTKTFDLTFDGEYIKRSYADDETRFGIKLDIAH